jgi:hypothetical protein
LARAVLRGQTPPTLFDYPLVEPVLDAARAVIVHNAASAERVRALRSGARVRVVPMGVPLPDLPPREEARARLGVAPGAFLVVSHGHVNPYKRLDVALRSFRRLLDERPDAQFLISGSVAPQLGTALDRQVRYLGLGGRVRRLGFSSPETVGDLLSAADCCVNLRYPSAGETSASLLRIMGAGLPVLVSDAGSFRELPDGCCAKIPVGPIEEALLAEYLIALARDETLRLSLGAAAREFVADQHSLERSATGYLDTLGEVLGRPLALPEEKATPTTAPTLTITQQRERPKGARSLPALFRIPRSPFRIRRNPRPASGVSVSERGQHPLADEVAAALADLRLAGHEGLERSIARDLVALGLGAGGTGKRARSQARGTDSSLRSE